MSTAQLIALDLLVGVLAAAAWLAAGATAAARRPRAALALSGGALLVTLARAGTALALAGRGWWFAQEKLVLAVPLLAAGALAAALLAAPGLLTAAGRPGTAPPASPRVVVPLFTAGYAAAAGPLVTLLLGYPVGWSAALIVLALVGAAAVVTARAMGSRMPASAAAMIVLVAAVGIGLAVRPGTTAAAGHAGHLAGASAVRGPATAEPGGTVRRYELTARTATVTLPSGRRVVAWTFNGTVPGPPITARQGDLVEVRLRNADIAAGVTLHWHGYDVPAGEDGVPGLTQDAVPPGGEFVYRFRADQVGTYWYHTHEVSDRGVRMGLYGTLVVAPRVAPPPGVDLTLPVHALGAATLVGDTDQPLDRRVAAGTPVRLRLINTDNTPRRFALAGVAYRLVAVDGTELSGPGELSRVGLRLAAGGRYDLAFPMPADPVALLIGTDRVGVRLTASGAATTAVGAAAVGAAAVGAAAGWPELDLTRYGTPAPTPFEAGSRFDRRFTMVLDRGISLDGGTPRYAHTVNGRAFPAVPTQVVTEGDLVRMTVVNRGRDTHPWHLHGHHVLVLARDGQRPSGSPLWLDTFDVRPGEVWEVAFRADNPGAWMNHCHNLSHADQGMMLHLAYRGFGA